MKRLGSGLAIRIAKEKNDPLYDKYERLRQAYLKVKQALIRKYRMAGMRAAKAAVLQAEAKK